MTHSDDIDWEVPFQVDGRPLTVWIQDTYKEELAQAICEEWLHTHPDRILTAQTLAAVQDVTTYTQAHELLAQGCGFTDS